MLKIQVKTEKHAKKNKKKHFNICQVADHSFTVLSSPNLFNFIQVLKDFNPTFLLNVTQNHHWKLETD